MSYFNTFKETTSLWVGTFLLGLRALRVISFFFLIFITTAFVITEGYWYLLPFTGFMLFSIHVWFKYKNWYNSY